MDKTHILVVDDDPAILRLVCANLKARGYRVSTAVDGDEALKAVEQDFVDLMVLDIMMPRLDGVEVCRRIREWSAVPIIVLSARGDEKDKVKCLELGADDYLTKPFGIAELLARIRTALRHVEASKGASTPVSTFNCDGLEINFALRRVTVDGKEIKLTPTEFSVLQQLAVNANKVLTHTMLLQNVWGNGYRSEKEYLRVFIGRLRKKLEPDPQHPKYIQTTPGVGYHLIAAAYAGMPGQ
ncbi:MAG: response regulator transcription factor [Dehalococcoidales bacterium]|nr:response regulator transcription factor [Dehalococcoidales bacterium]